MQRMGTVCEMGKCTGCMACHDICPKQAIEMKKQITIYQAEIDEKKCINCHKCKLVCQICNPVETKRPFIWYQGWANDNRVRLNSSSGGLASALSMNFIEENGVVCSCVFKNGIFGFEIFDNEQEVEKARGSKYVKSTMEGVYRIVRERLVEGKKVLFIGLPCQVAAIKRYIGAKLWEKLYTVDLICHGTPAPMILESFLDQYGYDLQMIENLSFRMKDQYGLKLRCKDIAVPRIRDAYTIAFLNGVSYTENCYSCMYAKLERNGDITLGDSWDSEFPREEKKKGISLILCQTEKGMEMLFRAFPCLSRFDKE